MSHEDAIIAHQFELKKAGWKNKLPPKLPVPEVLYIGCMDARLDPIDDIRFKKGQAFIIRNPGALVAKYRGPTEMNMSADERQKLIQQVITTHEFPETMSVAAAISLFINHVPYGETGKKTIYVSGHDNCKNTATCLDRNYKEGDFDLQLYHETMKETRAKVMERAEKKGWTVEKNREEILHELDEESVRQSVANVETFPAVKKAKKEGKLDVRGWVLDTHTHGISKMDPVTKQFAPLIQGLEPTKAKAHTHRAKGEHEPEVGC